MAEQLLQDNIKYLQRQKPFIRKQENESWIECIERNLKKRKFITRNECLQNYQTKLASRISELKQKDWKFEVLRVPYGQFKRGVDFVYWLKKAGRD